MAIKNKAQCEAAVAALDLQPGHRVLEIGFGPGVALELAARRAADVSVSGIDTSETMVRLAGRRLRGLVRKGQVELRLGSAEDLPWPDDHFDRAFEVNSLHHWPEPLAGLKELRRVLRTDGMLILPLRTQAAVPGRLKAPGYTPEDVSVLVEQLDSAGFRIESSDTVQAGREIQIIKARRRGTD
jgi:ubiquinone/menaquinone biosynthesis C-methylase UbiE